MCSRSTGPLAVLLALTLAMGAAAERGGLAEFEQAVQEAQNGVAQPDAVIVEAADVPRKGDGQEATEQAAEIEGIGEAVMLPSGAFVLEHQETKEGQEQEEDEEAREFAAKEAAVRRAKRRGIKYGNLGSAIQEMEEDVKSFGTDSLKLQDSANQAFGQSQEYGEKVKELGTALDLQGHLVGHLKGVVGAEQKAVVKDVTQAIRDSHAIAGGERRQQQQQQQDAKAQS